METMKTKLIPQPTNIDRATKESLRKLITDQHSKILALENKMQEKEELYILTGVNLIHEPFIPEYLGFSTELVEIENVSIRIYKRDEFRMVFSHDKWVITGNQFKATHTIENMLEGVIVLKSLGVDISVLDVVCCKYVS